MSSLLRNVTNGIWHAFMALHSEPTAAMVGKSKLKVLTANIASLFDLYGVEKGLEHYRSTTALHFDHYQYYLLQEVFAVLPTTALSLAELRNYEARIEEICWLICRRKYTVPDDFPVPEPLRFKLFRIFCMLADFVTRNGRNSQCEVLMHPSEAAQIFQQLMQGMGIDCDTDRTYNELSSEDCAALTFQQFLGLFALRDYGLSAGDGIERTESLGEAIEELHQTYIKDIIKKGHLFRRGYLLPTLKEYWFVLQPCELTYYKNATQRDLCGTIVLDANSCMVRPAVSSGHPAAAINGNNSASTQSLHMPSADKQHLRFSLTALERHFELAASDHRTRLQWIAALQLAITYSTGRDGYQRDQAARRRKRRELEQRRRGEQAAQRSRHLEEVQTTRAQLEHERLARLAAESQARELQLVVREDSRRVAELEDNKLQLERLLHEETLAKRDEEIVRALQARVLAEEWEKRAELEQLQEEQRVVLEQEREKRRAFEEIQREREQRLREAEQRLRQLEEERQKLDLELKQARSKIVHSERSKLALEDRLQLEPQGTVTGTRGRFGGQHLRRALSFMHSNREQTFSYDLRPEACNAMAARARSKSPQPTTTKPNVVQ